MLALYLSLSLNLDRPQWAMATAYIVSQPFSGAVRSKAVFRILGTLLGAAMVVLTVPKLSNAPVFLSLALAIWVGGCLYFSLLDRRPRSYVLLLAGYTATFIAFPSVNAPGAIFDVALSRVEEIGIGVLCSTFFHTVFFPRSMRRTIAGKLRDTAANLKVWTIDTLTQQRNATLDREQHRLAADITSLHMMATHVPFDTHEPAVVSATLAAIQDRLIVMYPIITSLSDRLGRLQIGEKFSEEVFALTQKIRDWVDLPPRRMMLEKEALLTQCRQSCAVGPAPSWYELLRLNLASRLCEFVETISVALELFEYFDTANDRKSMSAAASAAMEERSARPLHKDNRFALRIGLTTTGVIFCGCLIWIFTGWPEGDSALMMSCVVCCLFANLPNPVQVQRMFLTFSTFAAIAGGIYLFAILPMVHSFPTLVLAFAPLLLVAGTFMTQPGWEGKSGVFIIGFCGSFSLSQHFNPDFASFANRNAAQLIGIAGVVFATRILHNASSHQSIERLLNAVWRDLAGLATGANPLRTTEWTNTMLDRIGLMTPYVDIMRSDDRLKSVELMRDLRTGLNIIHLRESCTEIAEQVRTDLELILSGIGAHFETLGQKAYDVPCETLLREIDRTIGNVIAAPEGTARESVLNALTGLRCNLYPLALEYQAAGSYP